MACHHASLRLQEGCQHYCCVDDLLHHGLVGGTLPRTYPGHHNSWARHHRCCSSSMRCNQLLLLLLLLLVLLLLLRQCKG
jgi:hypothetical protein